MEHVFYQNLKKIPSELQNKVDNHWQELFKLIKEKNLPINKNIIAFLPKVLATSEYFALNSIQYFDHFCTLVSQGEFNKDFKKNDFIKRYSQYIYQAKDEKELMAALRYYRHLEMMRIIWRDLTQTADLAQTIKELSILAECILVQTLNILSAWHSERYGQPLDSKQKPQELMIIAVGKLGGKALNLSSDLDLIFAYPEMTIIKNKNQELTTDTFFTKLAQQLIKVIDETTDQGFVFRIDMRLRPYGDSGGQLVMSLNAMETYYQQQGREWERYALLKARLLNKNINHADHLITIINRFVFRRYIDYSVIDSLRNLKKLIQREVKIKQLQNNIKRGAGGIREIEFVAQVFQLIRGGQDKNLQKTYLLHILPYLKNAQYLNAIVVDELIEAYIFLRNCEHRLQAYHDQQTQDLPKDNIAKIRLAYAMGFPDWSSFHEQLKHHMNKSEIHFNNMITSKEDNQRQDKNTDILASIWLGQIKPPLAYECLEKLNFKDGKVAWELLQSLHENPKTRKLMGRGQQRLREIMPLLLKHIINTKKPEITLRRVITLIESIMHRSSYFVLLLENPNSLKHVVNLCQKSRLLAEKIAAFPILLDELLDARFNNCEMELSILKRELENSLLKIQIDDEEVYLNTLHRFKKSKAMKVANHQLFHQLSSREVGHYLSNIASVILTSILDRTWYKLVNKYGSPITPNDNPNFAIIAYGKLGSFELNYSSDLDLIFLYEEDQKLDITQSVNPISTHEFYTRLSQRIIHFLNLRSSGGSLYDVDTRLRPSGQSGLLISTIDAFHEYQTQKAWTWEHQALTRARVITGPEHIRKKFIEIKKEALLQEQDQDTIKNRIIEMREQMLKIHASKIKDKINIKQCKGGLIDIEFIVQYLYLIHVKNHHDLLSLTNNQLLLQRFKELNILTHDTADALININDLYLQRSQQLALQLKKNLVSKDYFIDERERVTAIWQSIFF